MGHGACIVSREAVRASPALQCDYEPTVLASNTEHFSDATLHTHEKRCTHTLAPSSKPSLMPVTCQTLYGSGDVDTSEGHLPKRMRPVASRRGACLADHISPHSPSFALTSMSFFRSWGRQVASWPFLCFFMIISLLNVSSMTAGVGCFHQCPTGKRLPGSEPSPPNMHFP